MKYFVTFLWRSSLCLSEGPVAAMAETLNDMAITYGTIGVKLRQAAALIDLLGDFAQRGILTLRKF